MRHSNLLDPCTSPACWHSAVYLCSESSESQYKDGKWVGKKMQTQKLIQSDHISQGRGTSGRQPFPKVIVAGARLGWKVVHPCDFCECTLAQMLQMCHNGTRNIFFRLVWKFFVLSSKMSMQGVSCYLQISTVVSRWSTWRDSFVDLQRWSRTTVEVHAPFTFWQFLTSANISPGGRDIRQHGQSHLLPMDAAKEDPSPGRMILEHPCCREAVFPKLHTHRTGPSMVHCQPSILGYLLKEPIMDRSLSAMLQSPHIGVRLRRVYRVHDPFFHCSMMRTSVQSLTKGSRAVTLWIVSIPQPRICPYNHGPCAADAD